MKNLVEIDTENPRYSSPSIVSLIEDLKAAQKAIKDADRPEVEQRVYDAACLYERYVFARLGQAYFIAMEKSINEERDLFIAAQN